MKRSMRPVAQYQRGNVALMALVCFTVVAFCVVLALDVGRLYLERRNLQRVADLVALDLASSLDLYNNLNISAPTLQSEAWEAAGRNGFATSAENTIVVERGIVAVRDNRNEFNLTDSGNRNAVRVELRRRVPGSIVPNMAAILPGVEVNPMVDIRAQAVAQRPLYATITAGTNLLTVSESSNSLLGVLRKELLGVDITALSYRGLLGASISLMDIATSLGVSVMNPEALLDTQVRAIDLINASISKLNGSGLNVELDGLIALRDGASNALRTQYFRLDKILNIQQELLSERGALDAVVSVGELLNAAVYAANQKVTISELNVNIGLAKVNIGSLDLTISQPPVVAVGPAGCVDNRAPPCSPDTGGWITEARPGQLDLDLSLSTDILGGVLTLTVNLNITSNNGRASLSEIELLKQGSYRVDIDGDVNPIDVTVWSGLSILKLPLGLNASLLSIDVKPSETSKLFQSGEVISLNWPEAPTSATLNNGPADVLSAVARSVARLKGAVRLLGLNIPIVGDLLGAVFAGLGGALTLVVVDVLEPLLTPLLTTLGLDVNTMDVRVLAVDAGTVELVK